MSELQKKLGSTKYHDDEFMESLREMWENSIKVKLRALITNEMWGTGNYDKQKIDNAMIIFGFLIDDQ